MKQSLKNYTIGALAALGVLALSFGCYTKYTQWTTAAQQSQAVYQFLAEPIAKNDKGEAITRADVLATVAKRVTDVANPPTGGAK